MTDNRLNDYLEHMQQAAQDACIFVEGMPKADFLEDKRTQQAVTMSLIVIGEAVDFDSYYLIWRKKLSAMGTEEWPALMLYGVAEVHRDLKLDPSDSPRVWQSKNADITSYSEKISSLNVDWLKDDNLDESQFMGLWHDRFLFGSKKEGSYIWIYAGI